MILDGLRQQAGMEELLICFTACSGLPLGEHGYVGPYRAWLHEELIHVPLIVRVPGLGGGLRVAELTQPIDLPPTLSAALGLPPQGIGQDLLTLVKGTAGPKHSQAVSGLAIGGSVEWALRTRDWAFLLPISIPAGDPPRQPQLFVKPDDRWEVNDVRQHHPETAEELEKSLRTLVANLQG
jgi:arylsulfatase A-like enzyme